MTRGCEGWWNASLVEFFDLRVGLTRSRRLAIWTIVIHAGALALVGAIVPALPWTGLTVPLIVASFAYTWRSRCRLEHPDTVIGLRHRDGWWLDTRDGRSVPVDLSGPQWLSGWLVVLAFRAQASKARYRVLVLPDQTDVASFRRLMRTVRWLP